MRMSPVTCVRRPATVIVLALVLGACGAGAEETSSTPESTSAPEADSSQASATSAAPPGSAAATTAPAQGDPTTTVTDEEPGLVGMDEVDLGEADWLFRPGANVPETVQVPLVDGVATVDSVTYTLGEVLHVDLNDDGVLDAAAQLTATDGNGVDDQWYLWVATDDSPTQVSLPIARMSRCGTVTESVTVADGGVQVHERRRGPDEQGLDCAATGTDERTRTVAVIEARNTGEWWPAQVAPRGGFGGICPTAVDLEGFPHTDALYAAPDTGTTPVTDGETVGIFGVEGWPVYGEAFPGWVLVGVLDEVGGNLRCAWSQVPG